MSAANPYEKDKPERDRERVGRKLKALRLKRGLDQIPAAEQAGISVGTLQAIERAWRESRESNVEKYAQLFGTTVRALLSPTTDNQLLAVLHQQREAHQRLIELQSTAIESLRLTLDIVAQQHAEIRRALFEIVDDVLKKESDS